MPEPVPIPAPPLAPLLGAVIARYVSDPCARAVFGSEYVAADSEASKAAEISEADAGWCDCEGPFAPPAARPLACDDDDKEGAADGPRSIRMRSTTAVHLATLRADDRCSQQEARKNAR
jgi:hypothetical protein